LAAGGDRNCLSDLENQLGGKKEGEISFKEIMGSRGKQATENKTQRLGYVGLREVRTMLWSFRRPIGHK